MGRSIAVFFILFFAAFILAVSIESFFNADISDGVISMLATAGFVFWAIKLVKKILANNSQNKYAVFVVLSIWSLVYSGLNIGIIDTVIGCVLAVVYGITAFLIYKHQKMNVIPGASHDEATVYHPDPDMQTRLKTLILAASMTKDTKTIEVVNQGIQFIHRFLYLDNSIKNEHISKLIITLQKTSLQIFEYIAGNPNDTRKLNRFMDYYLPEVIRFLDNYASLCQSAVKSGNMQNLLERISLSLNQFEQIFEHVLDDLYAGKVMDLDADITVLAQMMSLEGLGINKMSDTP